MLPSRLPARWISPPSFPSVSPVALVSLVEDEPGVFRLDGPFKLRFSMELEADEERIRCIEEILGRLGAAETTSEAA